MRVYDRNGWIMGNTNGVPPNVVNVTVTVGNVDAEDFPLRVRIEDCQRVHQVDWWEVDSWGNVDGPHQRSFSVGGIDYKDYVGEGLNQVLYPYIVNPLNMTIDAEVNVYLNDTLLGTQNVTLDSYNGTVLRFDWDTSTWLKGNYTSNITVTYNDFTNNITDSLTITSTFLVTIPGDVNGDRTVSILDAGEVSAHWYPGPPIGPLGYDPSADINNDGKVNAVDAATLNAHWHQSW